jgi:hypothetical protein
LLLQNQGKRQGIAEGGVMVLGLGERVRARRPAGGGAGEGPGAGTDVCVVAQQGVAGDRHTVAVAVYREGPLYDRAAGMKGPCVTGCQRHTAARRRRVGTGRERAELRAGSQEAGHGKKVIIRRMEVVPAATIPPSGWGLALRSP